MTVINGDAPTKKMVLDFNVAKMTFCVLFSESYTRHFVQTRKLVYF